MVHRFERADLIPIPWKNGGGVTHEIVRWPEHAGMDDFDWRVSIATIDVAGPFSTFPGVERVIVLLDGAVRLRSGDGCVDEQLEALVPFRFDGETPLTCTVAGASTDFNLMTRRDAWRSEVETLRHAHALSPSPSGVLFVIRGTWDLSTTATDATVRNGISLRANAGVWWHDAPSAWTVAPRGNDAALLALRLWPRRDRASS